MREKIKAFIEANRENIIRDWKDLVNCEGRHNELENMIKVAEHVNALFLEAGVDSKIVQKSPTAPPCVIGVIGRDRPGKPVLFNGHFDTVFTKGTFGENPFRIEDGKAYGPGVLDMKGGIIISLYVIKALESIGYNERPIRISYCGDEEGGAEHNVAARLIKEARTGCIAGFNMETGPVKGNLCVGRKFAMSGEFTVHGISAHSGNDYERGRNAVVEASYKIIAIQNMNDMEKGSHMNPAIVHGGVVPNSIPGECKVTWMGRFRTLEEARRVQREMRECFAKPDVPDTTIDYVIGEPSMGFEETAENIALFDFVKATATANGLSVGEHVYLGGGSDGESIAAAGTPVLCSCGVRGEWNHTDREYRVVESMFERCELWCNVILDIEKFSV